MIKISVFAVSKVPAIINNDIYNKWYWKRNLIQTSQARKKVFANNIAYFFLFFKLMLTACLHIMG